METKTSRNYGIDLLRMTAMFMVVILHVLKHGGLLDATRTLPGRYAAVWLLETAAHCAVDCYALISGYVGIGARYKYANIVLLWLRVAFYTVLITAVFAVAVPGSVGILTAGKAFFPVMTEQYWYFSCYFFLFFLIPLLNTAMEHLRKAQMRAILIGAVGIYAFGQTFFLTDLFGHGYDVLWLSILYLVGAYIQKYHLLEKLTAGKALLGYIALILPTWLSKFPIEWFARRVLHIDTGGGVFITYYSPTILGAGICLLLLFKQLNLPAWSIKIIKVFSPLAFSVYLIHEHPMVQEYLMTDRFSALASLPVPLLILAVLGSAVGIYLCCSLIDLVREWLFRVLKLRERFSAIENRWLGALWKRQG